MARTSGIVSTGPNFLLQSEDKKQAVQIRFSASEKSKLETAAALSGKIFSAFVRDAALRSACLSLIS
ncbi:MAG: DUF1778 domain-containing protein [Planctomycetaceae bacterium]|nr:DUF1778 domain-containing protein [Planctomycetaceae bacterium]